jgi:cell division septum initiation protein DivIVA
MSSLSLKQMSEQERASTARREASDRWNSAREEYAQLHAEIVAQYGEQNAPYWVESLRGPRVTNTALKDPS